jgi:hypothetical protein
LQASCGPALIIKKERPTYRSVLLKFDIVEHLGYVHGSGAFSAAARYDRDRDWNLQTRDAIEGSSVRCLTL